MKVGKTTKCIFIDKDVLSEMSRDEFKGIFATSKGLNIAEMNINAGDTMTVNGTEVTMDGWSIDANNVRSAVQSWLTANIAYGTSVESALGNENITDSAIDSLKACFVSGTYNA